ncbi:DUF397 domain-containing protein [Nonomuraea glycinis]|uniref:DUF397 domain-containing protein n=1 Tax=Nonomuraea glycinis TaxID=2047744 RepID=UPI002E11AD8A|nr:DUF397 domain-containing protein [Nonomuraea glycinis]
MLKKDLDLSRAAWRTSSFSGANGQCVQIAFVDGDRVAVRDSKAPQGSVLIFTADEWSAFTQGVKSGEFDL